MNDNLKRLAQELHKARTQKGLNQQALATKIGLPQGHISRIEQGSVDMKTSTLIELARALELELMLVPKELISTVQVLGKGTATSPENATPLPLYRLDED